MKQLCSLASEIVLLIVNHKTVVHFWNVLSSKCYLNPTSRNNYKNQFAIFIKYPCIVLLMQPLSVMFPINYTAKQTPLSGSS